MNMVIARIAARYLAGALIAHGLLDAETAYGVEPDMVLLLGAAIATTAETAYALARKRGWTT